MRFQAVRTVTIDAAHQLQGLDVGHPCARVHGHTYKFTVAVSSAVLDSTGMVLDFGILAAPIKSLEHQNLNEFVNQPTAENLAQYVWDEIERRVLRPLNQGEPPAKQARLDFITVQETENCSVTLARE